MSAAEPRKSEPAALDLAAIKARLPDTHQRIEPPGIYLTFVERDALVDEVRRCRAERDALVKQRAVLIRFAEVWLDGPGREEHGSMAWNFFGGVAHPPALGEVTP